jgi:superkiller protein 3
MTRRVVWGTVAAVGAAATLAGLWAGVTLVEGRTDAEVRRALTAARAERFAGNSKKALSHLARAKQLSPANYLVHRDFAAALLEVGRGAEALRAADAGLALRGDDMELLESRARALVQLGRDEEAVQAYDAVLAAIAPGYFTPWFEKAQALERLGDIRGARATYAEVVRLNPNDESAPRAIRRLDEEKDFADPACHRAVSMVRLGHEEEALETFRAVWLRKRDDPLAGSWIAQLLRQQGKPEEALAVVDATLAVRPNDWSLFDRKADVLIALGKDAEAIAWLDKTIAAPIQGYWEPWHKKADALTRLGRPREAIATLEDVLKRWPKNPDALARLEKLRAATPGPERR